VTRQLRPGGQQFSDDDGSAPPDVAAALAAYAGGQGTEHAALAALASTRLLVPVVAIAGERLPGAGEKDSEMALPTLVGQDGRTAIIAFTSLASLSRWREDARPVPAEASRVWTAAVAEAAAVVIDVAGPVPLAIEGARLAALATGQPVPLPHEDPDIAAQVVAVITGEPAFTGARLLPAAGQAELRVELRLAPAAAGPDAQAAIERAAARLSAALAHRLRAGIELTAAARGDPGTPGRQ
jgi:SseB protein N-terminal domain